MRPCYRLLFLLCYIHWAACTPASGDDTAARGRIQRLFEGPSTAELKEVGFTRFDAAGRKTEYKYLSTHLKFTYDHRDSLLRVNEINAQGVESKSEVCTYDSEGHMISDSFFTGHVVTLVAQYTYDAQGYLRSKTSQSKYTGGYSSQFTYNGDQLATELRKSGTGELTRIDYSYDANGRMSKADYNALDPQEHYSETFYYDASGRLSNRAERSGPSQEIGYKRYYAYDPKGRLVETFCNPEDGHGCMGKTVYSYNVAGDLIGKKEYAGERLILESAYRWELE